MQLGRGQLAVLESLVEIRQEAVRFPLEPSPLSLDQDLLLVCPKRETASRD